MAGLHITYDTNPKCDKCGHTEYFSNFKALRTCVHIGSSYYTEYECPNCSESFYANKNSYENFVKEKKFSFFESTSSKEDMIKMLEEALIKLKNN